MVRVLALACLLCLHWLRACDGWRDPYPGTVKLHTTLSGRPQGCTVQTYNEAGSQLRTDGVTNEGEGRLEKLLPGKYTLRFKNFDGQPYPAVVKFELYEAGELDLAVDLGQPPGPDGGTIVNSG